MGAGVGGIDRNYLNITKMDGGVGCRAKGRIRKAIGRITEYTESRITESNRQDHRIHRRGERPQNTLKRREGHRK